MAQFRAVLGGGLRTVQSETAKVRAIGKPQITCVTGPKILTTVELASRETERGSLLIPGQRQLGADHGLPVEPGTSGNVAIATPLPPGCYVTFWNNDIGFAKAFQSFPGYHETGDAWHFDDNGFIRIIGRTDDIMNVAGHPLSTGQIEQIIARLPGVTECAVIGADDAVKGMEPVASAVMSRDAPGEVTGPREIIALVREEPSPVAALKDVYIVDTLPKTRSGKILRAAIRRLANGEDIGVPSTIENPDVLLSLR